VTSAGVPANADELLARFKPQLRYDSQEAFFADSAAEMTDNPRNDLRRAPRDDGPGELIAAAPQLSLDFLGSPAYANGAPAQSTDRLAINGRDYRTQYVRLRTARADLRNRMYGHAALDSSGRVWLQYWFWYFYNDYHLAADFGLHEGDWEMVQLRLLGDEPDLAVYAQHRQAEKRPWGDVRRAPDNGQTPLVFPGRGSHASYFEPGLWETEAWYDIADGRRRTPPLELQTLRDGDPRWVAWPGQWGDTEPQLLPGLESGSPPGPARHAQWRDPHVLLESAVTRAPATPPPPPEVAVERAGGRLRVTYDVSRHKDGAPTKVIVTVNSVDEPDVPPRTFTFPVEDTLSGELLTTIDLHDARHYDVYVSVVSASDGTTTPSESRLIQLDPVGEPSGPDHLPTASIGVALARIAAWFNGVWRALLRLGRRA
jgi:hypothetical protein